MKDLEKKKIYNEKKNRKRCKNFNEKRNLQK